MIAWITRALTTPATPDEAVTDEEADEPTARACYKGDDVSVGEKRQERKKGEEQRRGTSLSCWFIGKTGYCEFDNG